MVVRHWLIGILSALVFFGVLEVGLRAVIPQSTYERQANQLFHSNVSHSQLTIPDLFLLDSNLLWRFHPHLTLTHTERDTGKAFEVVTDAHGHRIETPRTPRPSNSDFHIASFGDSCTVALEASSSYTKVLAEELSVGADNWGTSGYSSLQGIRQVTDYLAHNSPPDLVTLHFGHNDAAMAFEGIPDHALSLKILYSLRIRRHLSQSYLIALMFDLVAKSLSRTFDHYGRQSRVSVGDYKRNMTEMIHLFKAQGATVILLNTVTTDEDPSYLTAYNNALQEVAQANQAIFLDLWPLVKNKMLADKIHPNGEGHRWITQ